jgi:hypothetical protein
MSPIILSSRLAFSIIHRFPSAPLDGARAHSYNSPNNCSRAETYRTKRLHSDRSDLLSIQPQATRYLAFLGGPFLDKSA